MRASHDSSEQSGRPHSAKRQYVFATIIASGVTLFVVGIANGPLRLTIGDWPVLIGASFGFSLPAALKLVVRALLKRVQGESSNAIQTGDVQPFSGSAALDCVMLAAICLGLVGIILLVMGDPIG
jgi:hypothetical protein